MADANESSTASRVRAGLSRMGIVCGWAAVAIASVAVLTFEKGRDTWDVLTAAAVVLPIVYVLGEAPAQLIGWLICGFLPPEAPSPIKVRFFAMMNRIYVFTCYLAWCSAWLVANHLSYLELGWAAQLTLRIAALVGVLIAGLLLAVVIHLVLDEMLYRFFAIDHLSRTEGQPR